jgi:hypothetical protein
MKRIINLEYLKNYLSDYFWRLQNSCNLSPDYFNIIFKVELDHALTKMESILYRESDIYEVREGLRHILNNKDFDYMSLLSETANIDYTNQQDARDFFLYMWRFLFDDQWEYAQGTADDHTIVLKDKANERINVREVISDTKWCDNREHDFWGDTQLFFNGDGSGILCYSKPNEKNRILFRFRYIIKENAYTENTLIMIQLPDLNIAFEMAIHVCKALKSYYRNPDGSNTVLRLSDHPFLITQDFLNRRVHFPVETVFYQV